MERNGTAVAISTSIDRQRTRTVYEHE